MNKNLIFYNIYLINLIVSAQTWFMDPNSTGTSKLNVCGEWMPYKSQKCLKIIQKSGTEDEAKQVCQQLDGTASLLTIESSEEQEFMNSLLYPHNNESDKVWLGVDIHKLVLNPWNRESVYTNWADGTADLIGYHSCVQMSLSKATLGKWSDEPCRRRGLIVCQRRQEWTVQSLREIVEGMFRRGDTGAKCEELVKHQAKAIEQLRDVVDRQRELLESLNLTMDSMTETFDKKIIKIQKELSIVDSRVSNTTGADEHRDTNLPPIGYVYIQMPNQTAPGGLWPTCNWTDITRQYSGLFFRAEGEMSEPFGRIQSANFSRITNLMASALVDVAYTKVTGKSYTIGEGTWTSNLVPGKALSDLYLYQSEGENRPINTAIKIWKRYC